MSTVPNVHGLREPEWHYQWGCAMPQCDCSDDVYFWASVVEMTAEELRELAAAGDGPAEAGQ